MAFATASLSALITVASSPTSPSSGSATAMFSNLSFSLSDIIESILPFTMDYTCVAYFIVICFFIIVLGIKEFMEAPKNEKRVVFGKKWTFFCAVSIILFGMFGGKSFVYAQF